MKKTSLKKQAIQDLIIIFVSSVIPMIIYLFFEQQWRALNQSETVNFLLKFVVQNVIAFCLAGLGFIIVMILRKEKFSQYGLVKSNMVITILLSLLAFVPHFIFLMITKGFNGYIPMSGAIIFDSVMLQPLLVKIICIAVIFLVWGFCESFSIVYMSQKINSIWKPKNKWLNIGAIVCGVLFVFMHGGISFNTIVMFDAITMFIFIYGILIIKDITQNAWGCIFTFFFLWNAFPS